MATLHGSPLPEDFEDGKELTADAFNAVKDYWVVDELPEDAEDGDVVFVIGDSPVGDSGELPGIGGWATIESVTGNPTRYEYPAGNPEWVAFEWTAVGGGNSVSTSGGLVDVFAIGGGAHNAPGIIAGGSGTCVQGIQLLPNTGSPVEVVVGAGGSGAGWDQTVGGWSGFKDTTITTGTTGAGPTGAGTDKFLASTGQGGTVTSSITGSPVVYGGAGMSGAELGHRGGGGRGGGASNPGNSGTVILRVPLENDNTGGTGSTPASVVAAVGQAKETVKQTIKRNRRNR